MFVPAENTDLQIKINETCTL